MSEEKQCAIEPPPTWKDHDPAIGVCCVCERPVCSSHSFKIGESLYCWDMAGYSEIGCGVEVRDRTHYD